jgi:uncharacterized protein (DUF1697 family)
MGGKPRPPRRAAATHRAVAFLRGMNLGRRRITNDELRRIFSSIGFANVDLFLASGNVIFDSALGPDELEPYIAAQLELALDYPVATFVRTADEVRAIAACRPFAAGVIDRSAGKLQVLLLAAAPGAAAARAVAALATDDDRLAVDGRQIYWLPSGPMSQSDLEIKAIERAAGGVTIRTKRTIDRIAARYLG